MIRSKQRKRENPTRLMLLNDAFLMMYQTKSMQTDSTGYEIDARLEHQNAVKQTDALPAELYP